jgi:uncharacterized membrane protein
MARFCTNCGTSIDEAAQFCPKCGAAARGAAGTAASGGAVVVPVTSGLTDNVAGMLAYITIIPAIVFLVMAPYNQNRFIRFHSFQCIFFWVALVVLHIVLMIIPFVGWVLSALLSVVGVVLWIILLLKAYQGQMWKLPVVGDIAEKQANAM